MTEGTIYGHVPPRRQSRVGDRRVRWNRRCYRPRIACPGCEGRAERDAAGAAGGTGRELGDGAFVCSADLRDAAEPTALVEAAEQVAGPLHILVNNAAMTRDMLALRMSDLDWQAVLDIDLSAPFRLARRCCAA